jgi:dipeptidyl aminopeptidase/acylaminoacyl peptidase
MKPKFSSNHSFIILAIMLFAICATAFGIDILTEKYIPDIGTFMKIGRAISPSMGNTNDELFFVTPMSGVKQVYRLLPDGWPYQLTLFDDGIDWYRLSYAGDKAIVGASVGGSEDAQLYLMDTKTGRTIQLTDDPKTRNGTVVWKKDGSGFYYRSNVENGKDFKIYFLGLATCECRKIFDMEGTNSIADLSFDEKYLLIYHTYSSVGNTLYRLNLENGEYTMITPDRRDILYDYPSLMPDDKTVYLITNDNDEGITKLARFDIETKKLEVLEPDSHWPVDQLTFSPDRKLASWLDNEEGYSKIYMWDMVGDSSLPAPDISGYVSSFFLTDKGVLLFEFTSPTQTLDIWQWEYKTKLLKKITHSIYAGIDPNLFVEPILIKYKSFDGLEIPAFLYLPPDYDGTPVPFIIHIHGGPESQFRPYFQRHFQYLLLNGYGLLVPNVRGSSGYGIKYENLDNYKDRLNSVKDIKAGAEYLIKNGYTKPGKIGIKGGSYGGYMVLACITEYPNLFSAAVDMYGIANFVTFLENTRDYRRSLREAEYGPLSDKEFLESISPIHKDSIIKTPLLVMHGENDPRVPIGEARQIINAINESGGIVDSLIFSDEGHGINKLSNRLVLYRRMVEFFDKYLKKE